jgi:hypothetical protein
MNKGNNKITELRTILQREQYPSRGIFRMKEGSAWKVISFVEDNCVQNIIKYWIMLYCFAVSSTVVADGDIVHHASLAVCEEPLAVGLW